MPSSVTHTYFANCVLEKLPPHIHAQIKTEKNIFNLSAQGSDPFMFRDFFLGPHAKQGQAIQNKMHLTHTQNFFNTTLSYIKRNHLEKNQEVLSYLYGNICHYYLDLTMHPFIDYQAGHFIKGQKQTYYANTLHQKIEYRIDSYIIKNKLRKDPKTFPIHQYIFSSPNISPTLKKMIKKNLKEIYQIDNADTFYQKSLKDMKKFFQYVNYDPHGYKHFFYKTFDRITPKWMLRLEELSYHTKETGENYLNLDHQKWCFPWDDSTYSKKSFFDLWRDASTKTINTIIEIDKLLNHHKNHSKEKEIFSNLSYSTGLPCERNVKYQYFKENKNEITTTKKKR